MTSADALHLFRVIFDTPDMRELSVEERYRAVSAVIGDGLSISQVAGKVGVSRQTLHAWLARFEAEGLEGLADRLNRPMSCPHRTSAQVEAAVVELRLSRPYWGPAGWCPSARWRRCPRSPRVSGLCCGRA
jgi:transposase-like protein